MKAKLDAVNYSHPPYSSRYPALASYLEVPGKPANNRFKRNVVGFTEINAPLLEPVLYALPGFDGETTVFNNNTVHYPDKPLQVHGYGEDSTETLTWDSWQAKGYDAESRIKQPVFLNPDLDLFALRYKDDPVKEWDFQPIPIHTIGLYKDEFRASWPVVKDARRDGMEPRTFSIPAVQP